MTFEIHETEVDGVPTLWTDGGSPLTAILSFRVGIVDEPVPSRGITHLVEHLALGPLGVPTFDHNGAVEALRTMFVVAGSAGDVVSFLQNVTASLTNLPTERILLERAVLRRESAEQPQSIAAMLRGYRYGAAGNGVIAEEEHGPGWLGEDAVRSWAAEQVVRENAVLVLNQPPPSGLSLTLGSGRRWPAAPSREPEWLSLPAHVNWPHAGVAMTYSTPRGTPANTGFAILHRRARNALRFEDGTVYDVAGDYDGLDATTAHALVGADTDERKVDSVAARLLGVHDRLVADGPTSEELAAEAGTLEQQFDHPDGRLSYLDFQANERLLGNPPITPEEIVARRRSVTPDQVQAALAEASGRMLLASGQVNPAPDRLAPYPAWSRDVVTGDVYSPTGGGLFSRGRPERIVVGRDGVCIRISANEAVTVRYADAVCAAHLPDRRVLIGSDGFRIDITGKDWKNGQRVLDAIDAAIPTHLVACDEHTPGALADPEGRS